MFVFIAGPGLCASSPCQNNGTCLASDDRYHCFCAVGYSGLTCGKIFSPPDVTSGRYRLGPFGVSPWSIGGGWGYPLGQLRVLFWSMGVPLCSCRQTKNFPFPHTPCVRSKNSIAFWALSPVRLFLAGQYFYDIGDSS